MAHDDAPDPENARTRNICGLCLHRPTSIHYSAISHHVVHLPSLSEQAFHSPSAPSQAGLKSLRYYKLLNRQFDLFHYSFGHDSPTHNALYRRSFARGRPREVLAFTSLRFYIFAGILFNRFIDKSSTQTALLQLNRGLRFTQWHTIKNDQWRPALAETINVSHHRFLIPQVFPVLFSLFVWN